MKNIFKSFLDREAGTVESGTSVPVWWKWIKRGLWLGAFLYILLATFVWQFVFLAFAALVRPESMTNHQFEETSL